MLRVKVLVMRFEGERSYALHPISSGCMYPNAAQDLKRKPEETKLSIFAIAEQLLRHIQKVWNGMSGDRRESNREVKSVLCTVNNGCGQQSLIS